MRICKQVHPYSTRDFKDSQVFLKMIGDLVLKEVVTEKLLNFHKNNQRQVLNQIKV